MSAATDMLVVERLTKRFAGGRVVAVDGVSFGVGEGEFFTLLGPSGCGKTTTLRCLAGLERPDGGELAVAGRTLFSETTQVDVRASERGLGLVFQSYAIWPHMDVYDNVAFPLTVIPRRRRPSREQVRQRVERVLSVVKLDELARRRATDLSGGQQQRLALARALVLEPPLLLLDEPLSNLDARLREEMRIELKRLQRELGVTSVYVTHDQLEALAMSNTIAVMCDGKIEQLGRPRDVYERPASRFVADFVGAANVFEGVVDGGPTGGFVTLATPVGTVRVRAGEAVASGSRALVVVRPEHVAMTAADPLADVPHGRVLATGYIGDAVDHLVAVGELTLRVRTTPATSLLHGTEVVLGLDPEHCALVPV